MHNWAWHRMCHFSNVSSHIFMRVWTCVSVTKTLNHSVAFQRITVQLQACQLFSEWHPSYCEAAVEQCRDNSVATLEPSTRGLSVWGRICQLSLLLTPPPPPPLHAFNSSISFCLLFCLFSLSVSSFSNGSTFFTVLWQKPQAPSSQHRTKEVALKNAVTPQQMAIHVEISEGEGLWVHRTYELLEGL